MVNFLCFPQEIRSSIYQKCLVREEFLAFCDHDVGMKPCNPNINLHQRSVWQGNINPCDTYVEGARHPTDFDSTFMTYGKDPRLVNDPVNVNIFLSNRQIYKESRQVFYTYNGFHFTTSYRTAVPACLAFLHDRPSEVLGYVCSLSIRVAMDPYQGPAWYFVPMPSWRNLCDRLSRFQSLQWLSLEIIAHGPDVRTSPWRTAPVNHTTDSWDTAESLGWVNDLLTIKGLETLEIKLLNDHGLDENLAFVRMLGSRMLKNGNGNGNGLYGSLLDLTDIDPDTSTVRQVYFGALPDAPLLEK